MSTTLLEACRALINHYPQHIGSFNSYGELFKMCRGCGFAQPPNDNYKCPPDCPWLALVKAVEAEEQHE